MNNFNNYLKLYGYERFFSDFKNLLTANNLPQKILISGPRGIGKFTFVFHFINYYLSNTEVDRYDDINFKINPINKSFKLISNSSHPNFHIISLKENKKNIEIDQIRKIIKDSQKSSFNNMKKFIIIDNAELLNLNAANAILKLIEEPTDNLYFILIHDNSKKILETIKSRCITYKKNFSQDETLKIFNYITKSNPRELFNLDFFKYYFSIGDLLFLIDFATKNNLDLKSNNAKTLLIYLISNKIYKNDSSIHLFMFKLIQCYFYEIFIKTKNTVRYNDYTSFIKKINYTTKYNLDFESLFLEFKDKILYE